MNTYFKYCPNVFLAKTEGEFSRGESIILTTKYGKENEHIVYNHIFSKDGYNYYSIIRADGYNLQERAKRKAERFEQASANAEKRSMKYFEASQEGKDFLSLAEPIKIGHHSEKRHRALIERNWNRMGKSVAESEKAGEYQSKAEYWKSRENEINLSIPDSLMYYEHKLDEAIKYHQDMKNGIIEKSHSYSLTYAKKEVNNLTKLYELAVKLWAEPNEDSF